MYDDINFFLNCTTTVFMILALCNIYTIHQKVNNISLMVAMGIVNSDTRLQEIEKALHLPPRYEESSSPGSEAGDGEISPASEPGEEAEQIIDEAEQVPYTPSPPFDPIQPNATPFDLNGID